MAKVGADETHEANDGHDGTWVAYPGLVSLALEAFKAIMKGANQIERKGEDVQINANDQLDWAKRAVSEAGLRTNSSVGVHTWNRG